MKKRTILVTSALPYANGPIHLGHLVEYIQSDIWCRYLKSCQHHCWHVCADDAHGTPIMIKAQKQDMPPEELIAQIKTEHESDLHAFFIAFDHYTSTHTENNKKHVYEMYHALQKKGLIEKKKIEQFYDTEKNIFLPDRFIKGICPRCAAKDQYGDGCEQCGSTYNPTELKEPYSTLSQTQPCIKESEHYFFKLSDPQCVSFLREWLPQSTQEEVQNKVLEWVGRKGEKSHLADWNISRDAPYFGFSIPNSDKKFFYVWFDAPIAYISAFSELQNRMNQTLPDVWNPQEKAEIYHFIGKDVIYFHTLFWPAVLQFSEKALPSHVFVHGFLTLNKEKMSKSKGCFIRARDYLNQGLNPEWMRYYIAAHSGSSIKDIDLNKEEFFTMINSHLIGKYINILSRISGFVRQLTTPLLSYEKMNEEARHLEDNIRKNMTSSVLEHYEERNFSKAVREIMLSADQVNRYIEIKKPWLLVKEKDNPEAESELLHCLSACVRSFVLLTGYLQPVLPETARKVALFLGISSLNIAMANKLQSENIQVSEFQLPLMARPCPEHDKIFF